MKNDLYRLVYCSRNRACGSEAEVTAEIDSILASARSNNEKLGVTGALLYNSGYFAQVLEGTLHSIESVFEVIQRDYRHSEVTVVQSGLASERQFPEWSMAFVESSHSQSVPAVTAAFDAVFASTVGAGEHMLNLLENLLHGDGRVQITPAGALAID